MPSRSPSRIAASTPIRNATGSGRFHRSTDTAVPYAPTSRNPTCPKFISPVYPNCTLRPIAASA
jgi:hypothetical protein